MASGEELCAHIVLTVLTSRTHWRHWRANGVDVDAEADSVSLLTVLCSASDTVDYTSVALLSFYYHLTAML